MSLQDRIINGVMAFGYLIGSVFIILIALGWTTPLLYLENYLLYTTSHWLMGITGAILFGVAFTVFLSNFRSKPVKFTVIHETTLGAINITLPALENLVLKSAHQIQGIKEVKPLLKIVPGQGLAILLKVQVAPDINIPSVTESLQKAVKEYLLKTAGINVEAIRISVNRISWDGKSRVE